MESMESAATALMLCAGGDTVVDTSGKIESPPLEKVDEGWHYTFDEVGTFELFVKQHPMAKVRVNVVSKKD